MKYFDTGIIDKCSDMCVLNIVNIGIQIIPILGNYTWYNDCVITVFLETLLL